LAQAQNYTTFIVTYADDMLLTELHGHIATVLGDVQPTYIYQHALKGFAAPLSPQALLSARKHPKFKMVEEDQIMHAYQGCGTVHEVKSWGQSRVSERDLPIQNDFHTAQDGGSGVKAYIIDTGIRLDHDEFAIPNRPDGRASFGFKAQATWTDTDGNGHGTHVSSTVGGNTVGLASDVALIAVKVLGDNGSGTTAGVIAGVDWVTGEQNKDKTQKCVANMSLGGGLSSSLNNACDALVAAGTFLAVAAGNDNANACSYSPASARLAYTVGSTGRYEAGGPAPYDVRSSFSNWGTCVDVFAPGARILGAGIATKSSYTTLSGTSMASPHACGTAALYWSDPDARDWSVSRLKVEMLQRATDGKIDMLCSGTCAATVNKLTYTNC
jgi:subtilisin family serine protease